MLAPKTYRGYDQEGNVVVTVTAYDANQYLNPTEVKAAIDNLESVAQDAINKISNALMNVAPDANEAVIVQGTKIQGTIEDVCSAIKTLPGTIVDNVSSMYTESITAHDRLQTKENEAARAQAGSYEGVVSVR